MSELKGQLLGMILVLAAFGTILGILIGILIPAFATSAEAVNKNITVDANGSVKFANPNMTVTL